ncbi:MAG: fused MFS/spermidine synthase [Holophagales bacterium]|nr:fused MFS/spermidine synthase [Holophagales bacterium]
MTAPVRRITSPRLPWRLLAVVLAALALASTAQAEGPPARAGAGSRVTLALKETPFQVLRVDEEPARGERLLCDRECTFVQGAMSLSDPSALVLDYARSALLSLAFLGRPPQRVLFLGLGAGSMPRFVSERFPAAEIDVVEIDPEVPTLAERYFRFQAGPRLRVFVGDAADFVRRRHVPYDLVVLDACFGPEPPPQLATPGFFRALRGLVVPGGVVVANLASPVLAPSVNTLLSTMRGEFPSVEAFLVPNAANLVAIAGGAAPDAKELAARAAQITSERRLGFDLERLARESPRWPVPPVGR